MTKDITIWNMDSSVYDPDNKKKEFLPRDEAFSWDYNDLENKPNLMSSPEWTLYNWQIVTSVSYWNLTVAIKTLAWKKWF